MTYAMLKMAHVVLALLSIAGFMLRGWWMLRESPLLRAPPVRILPHVVDTLLLASGIALAVWVSLNPVHHPWLMAKIIALVVYILVGTVALKRGPTRTIRAGALAAAIAVYGYMLATAVQHDPLPFL